MQSMAQNSSTPNNDMRRQGIIAIEDNQFANQYYANEASHWRGQVALNEKDEYAWLNLYKATRFTNYTEHDRDISTSRQNDLDALLVKMKKAIPESFAYNYSAYLNGNKSNQSFTHLEKAYKQGTEVNELWDDMLSKAVIQSNQSEINKFSNLLSENHVYNSAEVTYNRNVLSSVEQNGILITNGNVDTYPVIMMQQLQNYRKDVNVLCIEWLGNETYSNTVSDWLGLKTDKKITLPDIMASKSSRPLYLTLTVPPDDIKKYSDNLYCTGLAMKYSKTPLDNLAVLSSNWERLFDKTTLQSSESLNKNYLVPLVLLRDYYSQKGNTSAKAETSQQIEQIATVFGLSKVIQKHKD